MSPVGFWSAVGVYASTSSIDLFTLTTSLGGCRALSDGRVDTSLGVLLRIKVRCHVMHCAHFVTSQRPEDPELFEHKKWNERERWTLFPFCWASELQSEFCTK